MTSDHPAVTVYVSARVYDQARARVRTTRRKGRQVKDRSGGMRHCWSLRLQRWTPEEVQRHIIDLFTRLAKEDEECTTETQRVEDQPRRRP